MIFAPGGDTAVVGSSALVIDDERIDAVTQTFLYHNQTSDATVVILEWSDLFEADVEVQDTLHIYRAFLVFLQEGGQRGDDVFVRNADL